jgi:hypothetical protein
MSETLALKSPVESLTFQILQLYNGILPNNNFPINTYGPPAPNSVIPTSSMNGNTTFSITLNFFRVKKYKNDYFRNT